MQVIDHNRYYPRAFFLVSNNFITEVEIIRTVSEFSILKFVNENKVIQIRSNRLFSSYSEAEKQRELIRKRQKKWLNN